MTWKDYTIAFVLVFISQLAAIWLIMGKTNNTNSFNLVSSAIVKDLDGRSVNVMLNQVWPFDASQNIDLQITSKKAVDEYVVVVAEVSVVASVQEAQLITGPKEKDKKLPSKLHLHGKMKLTYEYIDSIWYLVGLENLSLKVTPN